MFISLDRIVAVFVSRELTLSKDDVPRVKLLQFRWMARKNIIFLNKRKI